MKASQCLDSGQITASHRVLACFDAYFHRWPGPNPGVRIQIQWSNQQLDFQTVFGTWLAYTNRMTL